MVGDVGIQEELDLSGYSHFGGPEDAGKTIDLKPGFALPHDENVSTCLRVVLLALKQPFGKSARSDLSSVIGQQGFLVDKVFCLPQRLAIAEEDGVCAS